MNQAGLLPGGSCNGQATGDRSGREPYFIRSVRRLSRRPWAAEKHRRKDTGNLAPAFTDEGHQGANRGPVPLTQPATPKDKGHERMSVEPNHPTNQTNS